MKHYLAICLLLASVSAYGALHKWVDDKGVVHYSDTVPSTDIKAQTIRGSTEPDSVTGGSGVAAPKTFAEREADLKKAQKARSEAEQKAAREQEAAASKKKSCDDARSTLATLENAPRLATYDAQGERTIMDDDARQQRIEETRKFISSNCN